MGLTTLQKIMALAELGYSIEVSCAPYARTTYFVTVRNNVSPRYIQYSNKNIDEVIDQVYRRHTIETWTAQNLLHPDAPPYTEEEVRNG